jgi:type I restriction-modification system DNA methylase subunit
MGLPKEIADLIERFDRNRESYLSGQYNETQLRREFLDPFFSALGWDVENKQGYAEAYKEVIHEDALKIGGATKAPDYCFRIGSVKKFFVEAKKPSVNLKDDISPAFQLRRYAWSAKLPLSILTDFEEFVVYDCRIKPVQTDKASTGRVLYFTYKDYPAKWDELVSIFSREAVLKGSFDKYAESTKLKKGTATVDDAFLTEIEDWRDHLARNIAIRNPNLSQRELNFAVQRTIDRIVFLRICEDRGIEEYGRLQMQLNGTNVYKRLVQLFNQADDRYNSGLFHFQREKERHEEPDKLTPNISLDDKPLKDIINRLYYPESPYEFSVLSADILGQVYEQFLGKVIRLTAGHQAKVEEKPEVRKAGGVYYTPKYIVDYIVKNTVGKLVEGKKPKEVEKLKILDPACGSGSFLLGAYQYLLDWHLKWYIDNEPDKWAKVKQPTVYQGLSPDPRTPNWHLTTAERKRILLNNIYGVDIDSQAVEVTKLSLLLKVLEGENNQTLANQLRMFHERALPDLGDNIKCGNSLIGPDFYQQQTMLDDDERYHINVFDWEKEYSEIMNAGGFDAVIGNPPYIGFHGFEKGKEYLTQHYLSAEGKFDIYLPFLEKGISNLRKNGLLGYICPTNFTKRDHGERLRTLLSKETTIIEITDFEDCQVFKDALNYTGVFIFEKLKPSKDSQLIYKRRSLLDDGLKVDQISLGSNAWVIRDRRSQLLIDKVHECSVKDLGSVVIAISEGIVTGLNKVFLLTKDQVETLKLEREYLRPCLRGSEVRRYSVEETKEYVIYPYKLVQDKTRALSESELQKAKYLWEYLKSQKQSLSGRPYFERSSKQWYELWNQRDLNLLAFEKIVVAELANSARFSLANPDLFYGDTVCGISIDESIISKKYVLGLLNSKLLDFYFKKTTVPKANGYYIYKTMFLNKLPIRLVDFSNAVDKTLHDKIVNFVDEMLILHRQLIEAKTDNEKTALQRQIDAFDHQINESVYALYYLTAEEIKIVEENN